MSNAVQFEYECPECGKKWDATCKASRPAPACCNPNSPKFSDPGDSQEVTCDESKCTCGHEITDADLEEQGATACEEQRDNAEESAAEAAAEARAERRNESD